MYVSHAVRSLRDDPVTDADVTLVVTLAGDADEAAVADRLRDVAESCDGTYVGKLEFDTISLTVSHAAISAVCAVDGIERVETDATLGITPGDAGEDLDEL